MSGNKNVYGLQSFTDPQDAFEVVCLNWGSNTEEMAILDDYRFSQVIVERAIKANLFSYMLESHQITAMTAIFIIKLYRYNRTAILPLQTDNLSVYLMI